MKAAQAATTDYHEALATVRRLTDAWIAKDRFGMACCLTDDITEIGSAFTSPLIGKKDFFRKYKPYFSGPLKIESYQVLRPRVIPLSSRLVLVYFSYRMRTTSNGRKEQSRGKESMLVEKRRRCWLVKFIHWHRDPDR